MSSRLLQLLVLYSLCSATMGRYTTQPAQTVDPNPDSMDGYGMRSFHIYNSSMDNHYNMAMCDMLMNGDGPVPIDHFPVYCLCSYCKGNGGHKGELGDQGRPGPPGSPGRRGLTGFRGRPGFIGSHGIKGQKGQLGDKGQPGEPGFIGAKGERGYKGEKGDRGMLGYAGVLGPQGEPGTCPTSCGKTRSLPGPQGPPGLVGVQGLPGVSGVMGPKGSKGDKGDMGIKGDPGVKGYKGDHGEQGICECADGEHGTDGAMGEKGDKGDKGTSGEHGAEGTTGLKGNKGYMGSAGLPGPCSSAIQSAFSACIVDPFPLHNYPVPFPHVITNLQGHFNPVMGMYTAPTNGTYVLGFYLAVSSKVLKVGMFHNFKPVVINTEVTDGANTGQTIVLHLYVGDRVWLQVKDSTTNGMYTDSENKSTFTGYLLHPDTCDLPERRDLPMYNELAGDFTWATMTNSTDSSP